MVKPILKISFLFVLLIVLSIQGSTGLDQTNQVPPNQAQLKNEESPRNLSLNPDFGKIPLYFIPNEGQVDEKALFYTRASKYTLWLTKEGLVFDSTRRTKKEGTNSKRLSPEDINNHEDYKYDRDVSRLTFINANRKSDVVPLNDTELKVNYFIGNDASKWRSNIQTSRAVLYKELYPNIDLKVYGIEKQIEYDFIVKPGGEVLDIAVEYIYVEKTTIDEEGNLIVKTRFGELEHAKPVCYQVIEEERVEIKAEFKRKDDNTYGFMVEEYNKEFDLIIDPLVLVYSTYLGGSDSDSGSGIAVDSEGAAYVTGITSSLNFPTKNPIYENNPGESRDVFITKINSAGDALVYSTYLGGSDSDSGSGIAVDSEGAAYVTGDTRSTDFPTKNPIQGSNAGDYDTFITKINSSGNKLIYSTYLGGSDYDQGEAIVLDLEGAAYITGMSGSNDFPTKNPIQESNAGESDAFITKINPSGNKLLYSTYLGGSGREQGFGIAVDSEGAAYVVGWTKSSDFPIQYPLQGSLAGESDAFITKINPPGNTLVYSTYLGGSGPEAMQNDIAVDSEGAAYVAGRTSSYDFPIWDAIQDSRQGGDEGYITKINPLGSALIFSTYLGGSGYDFCEGIALDRTGAVYVTGKTDSIDFPTFNPVQDSYAGDFDAIVTKISGLSEKIRIVSWNILDYPDMIEEPREEYFQSILKQLNPDILVVQEMASAAGVSQFLKEVLNPKKPKLYKAAKFFDGPDTDNALFYKKAKIGQISRQQIPTSYRDVTEYKMKIKKGAGKGTKFKIYSIHFSEGAGAKKKRENEALTLRTYLDGLLPDELFLVCGSFNMMSSTEKAFKILTGNQVNNNGRLMDPIHKTGKWHDKSKHKRIHTESTRKSKFGGGTAGGLDDRYDMILISYGLEDNEKLIYSEGSCSIFGNDGKHLNKAINKPKNKIVSPEIADALYMASDHLPVIIDLVPQDESK